MDENNQPTVNTPEFKAAFENYIKLYKLGDTMDKDDIVAAIDSGEAALGQGWPGWYVPTADSAANYTVIPTKLDDNDTPKNTSMYGVWTIGVCENSQNKDLALELLKYLMDPQTQLESIDLGGVPLPGELPDEPRRAGQVSPPGNRLRRTQDRRVPPRH